MTVKCNKCKEEINKEDLEKNYYICPLCGKLNRMPAKNRLQMLTEKFDVMFNDQEFTDPIDFPSYKEKYESAREKSGETEGVVCGRGTIGGNDTCIFIMEPNFMMGSMGTVVGDRITALFEYATKNRLPVIGYTVSGGARMQEGIVSLMQMAKTAAALKKHSDAGLLYISVLTDPTTGGVTASFAMLGDIILAEPGALIGFAGARVIEQTIGQKLPEGFQRAEFQLEHGFVDAIVERKDLKKRLYEILRMHKVSGYAKFDPATEVDGRPTELMRERAYNTKEKSAWEKVKMARKVDRLSAEDYINSIFTKFIEFHGDRYYRDDPAIVGGIAYLDGQPVTVIGIQKGKDMKDCMRHNYGMPSPEGYRKAIRLMKQAEKFHRPVITFVNTAGAFCGMEAEEGGQGEAIARNLYEMSGLKVPVITFMIGEGGSGGALALAVGNEVCMMENATYSVLSPEGFASILWKDGKRAKEAAEVMKITAKDLLELGIIEKIIPEYGGADDDALSSIAVYMHKCIREFLESYEGKSGEEIAKARYERFRKF